ncbi:hypothetical protein TNCV_5120201 [Trichonephila clavipes]|nr:hypothetical protein TNCV_5120201 [Trichonephila clavipes]
MNFYAHPRKTQILLLLWGDSMRQSSVSHHRRPDITVKSSILRQGKEVSASFDKLKTAYVPKDLEDIIVRMNRKEKISLQTEDSPEAGQRKPTESSSRQETPIRAGCRVRFNPKYS